MSILNPIDVMFEVEVTPEQLFDWANKLDHYGKTAMIGQVIRVKISPSLCFVYKPPKTNISQNSVVEKES
jgi:hypothetical protein